MRWATPSLPSASRPPRPCRLCRAPSWLARPGGRQRAGGRGPGLPLDQRPRGRDTLGPCHRGGRAPSRSPAWCAPSPSAWPGSAEGASSAARATHRNPTRLPPRPRPPHQGPGRRSPVSTRTRPGAARSNSWPTSRCWVDAGPRSKPRQSIRPDAGRESRAGAAARHHPEALGTQVMLGQRHSRALLDGADQGHDGAAMGRRQFREGADQPRAQAPVPPRRGGSGRAQGRHRPSR